MTARFLRGCLLCLVALTAAPIAHAQLNTEQLVQSTWVAGLQQMAAQLSAVMVGNSGAQGMMMDGQMANTAVLAQQRLAAGGYQSYTPSETLCRMGTLSRSLASADQLVHDHAGIVHQILLNRETHNVAHGRPSADYDPLAKLGTYANTYCNPGDNDGVTVACKDTGAQKGAARFNRDLDYTRLLLAPGTLNLNFADGTLTDDEQDVLGFATNISAFRPLPSLSTGMTSLKTTPAVLNGIQAMRALTAKRGMVRATLSETIARKSPGGPGSSFFMANVLREMGMSDVEADRVIRATASGAGYDAQMEILTKKLYQNPNFYTNLVDKPDALARTQAGLQAIKLMQGRDVVQSSYRRELLLAQLLEQRLKEEEALVQGRVNRAVASRR